jgi:hypothetical protein
MNRVLLSLTVLLALSLPAFGQQKSSFLSLAMKNKSAPPVHTVALTWTAATCSDGNGNAINCPSTPTYAIYRSATQGGGETCVQGRCYGYCCRIGYSGNGVLTYTDPNAGSGQTWYYVVTTVLPPCPPKATSTTPPCGESAVSNEVQATTPGKSQKKKKQK